ncbi:MAG: aminotransferase class V-fold PLP-dependent enzyme [Clostridia bacterium]|nr:aminotransferase class V-fold PLP-dependent enzyme [Clostridia bacterium]MBQ2272867.1 aminotransferase class V-fold PLP-dependent enzyme [Clostridia bacterium]MBQ5821081.1 aminotransferase class V-fold PLP-dependent enzyme [Clostridia bacterium]
MIYLDNAASSHPKPPEVIRAVERQLRRNGANPGRSGHRLSAEGARVIYDARRILADGFGTDSELVIFTSNTTDAINRALKGVLNAGDHVVISDLEHNSVLRPLKAMEPLGVTFSVAQTKSNDEEALHSFQEAIRPNTRLIFCTHASNVTGRILPIRQIADLCRERGILFGVDGAQTAGLEDIDLKRDGIDLLCIPGHKSLLGPQGTGALLLGSPLELTTMTQGGTGTESLSEYQPSLLPDAHESGTMNTPGIAGLAAGTRFAMEHRDAIRSHEAELRAMFCEELKSVSGFRLVTVGESFVPTLSLIPESVHSEAVTQYLDRCGICTRGGYHCSALAHRTLKTEECGTVRISFGYRNTEEDVEECIKYLKKYLNNSGRA